MDQAVKCRLVALATVQVRARIEAMMDLDTAQAQGQEFMAAVATGLGRPAREGRREHEAQFPSFKAWALEWAAKTAETEVARAVEEAGGEQEVHSTRLRNLAEIHDEAMNTLVERHKRAIPDDADVDFIVLINTSHEDMMRAAQRFHDDLMQIVREKHRLNLWHAFARHQIPEGSVLVQLIDLYEVK